MFWVKFYMVLSFLSCLEMVRQVLESNLGIEKSKLRFWGEKWVFPERCTVTASPISCSCVFFTRFCFELAFFTNTETSFDGKK
ncbi:hypothetical protein MTR_4g035770 [Medicago truncatula]|uniref:Transmembrane protein n=1 Tax=Medicago truncatula TaxID=3880 RepID=A0A072UI95_MEDTR|nr:hypothetical protein MTR_4g035770 [Medicago truncatula]